MLSAMDILFSYKASYSDVDEDEDDVEETGRLALTKGFSSFFATGSLTAGGPDEPDGPGGPDSPCGPGNPVGPGGPVGPDGPGGPDGPCRNAIIGGPAVGICSTTASSSFWRLYLCFKEDKCCFKK